MQPELLVNGIMECRPLIIQMLGVLMSFTVSAQVTGGIISVLHSNTMGSRSGAKGLSSMISHRKLSRLSKQTKINPSFVISHTTHPIPPCRFPMHIGINSKTRSLSSAIGRRRKRTSSIQRLPLRCARILTGMLAGCWIDWMNSTYLKTPS